MDNSFDPDSYIASNTQAQGFNPDAYIASNAPDEGAPMAFGRGLLRNIPMAQQAAAAAAPVLNKVGLADKANYSDELQHMTEAADASKAAHKGAYGAGAVTGTLAPMAVPVAGEALGLSGPALEMAGGAGIAGGALSGGAQGLSDTNLTRNPAKIIKDAAPGAVLGGALGGLGNVVSAVAPSEKALGASMTGTGMNFNSRGAQSLMRGADPEAGVYELGQWANDVVSPEGKKLAEYVRPGDKLKALGEIHDSAGEQIGSILKKAGNDSSLPAASLTKDLYPLVDSLSTRLEGQQNSVSEVIKEINTLSAKGELDLTALNKIKSSVGALTKDSPAMAQVYGSLSDSVNNAIDEFGRIIGDPSDRAAFDAAKLNYKNASNLLPILRKAEGREIAEGPLGNSGLLGMIGGAGALASGHPVGAAATMAGSAIGRPIANTVGRNAMLRAVPYAPEIAATGRGLSKAAQLELANALQSKFGQEKK